jgi:hypothetical protein
MNLKLLSILLVAFVFFVSLIPLASAQTREAGIAPDDVFVYQEMPESPSPVILLILVAVATLLP